MKLLPLLLMVLCAGVNSDPITIFPNALWQFRNMILCSLPDSWPLFSYSNYGCYCGLGGSGSPVDDLDRCCQIHDHCYNTAMAMDECWPIFDNPYTEIYTYSCSDGEIICSDRNNPCEAFICECDRAATLCFSKAGYDEKFKNLNTQKYCKA
ncbi:phospholipase A2 [Latimeria chalumnae]|nr:PREDICTED: phospholipase A2, minor isoenzyme-like [Latimeria chalumnae]|eukprot:XP_005987223.1 PREDICTED: phospholipase A2, minor isoenzyme-like [Latimeria chalumnae]